MDDSVRISDVGEESRHTLPAPQASQMWGSGSYNYSSFMAPGADDDEEEIEPLSQEAIEAIIKMQAKKQQLARRFLLETIAYGLFIFLFCLATYGFRPSWGFYLTDMVRGGLLETAPILPETGGLGKNYFEILTQEDFYLWARQIFFPNYFAGEWYNGDPREDPEELKLLSWYNFRVGGMRWRQIRVQKDVGCKVSKAFKETGLIDSCYPSYKDGQEDTEPFGPGGRYVYKTADELCGETTLAKYCKAWVVGKRSDHRYSSNGYAFDFSYNSAEALQQLDMLQHDNWIGPGTRVIMIDFTLYNPGINQVIATQLIVEVYPTGALATIASIKPMPLMTMESVAAVAELIAEITLSVWVLWYIFREILEFWRYYRLKPKFCVQCVRNKIEREGERRDAICVECNREFHPFQHANCPKCQRELGESHKCWRGYFQDLWNTLDIINDVLFITVFIVRFRLRFDMADYDYNVGEDFFLFYPVAWRYSMANYFNSFNAFLCFLKLFKYLGKFKALSYFVRTLEEAKEELTYLLIIFGVIFGGFVMAFHMAFGDDIKAFRHWFDTGNTLFATILGDFNYFDMQESNRMLAPIFFFFFIILVFFVLINMFIAVIGCAYAAASFAVRNEGYDFLGSSLKLFFRDIKYNYLKFIFGKNQTLFAAQRILDQILLVNDLDEQKKDDIRTLKRKIDHDAHADALCAQIAMQFDNVEATRVAEDYFQVKKAVIQHMVFQRKVEQPKTRAFEDQQPSALEISTDEINMLQKSTILSPEKGKSRRMSMAAQLLQNEESMASPVPNTAVALNRRRSRTAMNAMMSSMNLDERQESTFMPDEPSPKNSSPQASFAFGAEQRREELAVEVEQRQKRLSELLAQVMTELEKRNSSYEEDRG
eukprot:TRINITY_DN63177_c0_g1_i1.p1 TRINITY_DN63177_c0_g1~~TRINITY_DN63177_c0_g1_i1.p1  ORF type:complete len:881 (-),score=78.19 TRINITY_DN63177_c0_g1_i1:2116-4758(-)